MKPGIRLPVIYGSIAAVLTFSFLVLLYYLNRHPFLIPAYLDSRIFVFAVFMFLLLREIREAHYGGILYFWQGITACFLFIVVFALITSLAIVLLAMIVPSFVKSYIDLTISQIQSLPTDVIEKIGKDVVQSNLNTIPSTTAFELGTLYFGQSFMIGLFLTIIISVISRRTPNP
jgi:hypothetical protein